MATPRKRPEDLLKVGRPTKYKPEFCQLAIDLLSEGHSLYALASECNVSFETLMNWQNEHPEFLESIKIGKAKSAHWWENRVKEFAITGVGNATAIIFGLKNRARKTWQDKQEMDVSVSRKEAIPDFGEL